MSPASVTVNSLLPEGLQHFDTSLQSELTRQGADKLPDFAWKMIESDAQQKVHEALDINLFEFLAGGWCVARELREYADPKLHPPTELSDVFLGEHTLTSTARPEIVVTVGTMRLPPVALALELSATFRAVALTIQNGYILALHAGDCWVSAQFKLADQDLCEPVESRHFPLPGKLPFTRPGLQIRKPPSL